MIRIILAVLAASSFAHASPTSDALATLATEDALLRSAYTRLLETGNTTENIYRALATAGSSDSKRFLTEADRAFLDFQDRYDRFNNEKLDVFAAITRNEVLAQLDVLKYMASNREYKSLVKKAMAMEASITEYQKLRPLFGQAGDHLRINAYRDIFKNAKKFMKQARKIRGADSIKHPFPVKAVASLAPEILKMLWNLEFHETSGPGELPVLDSMGRIWVKLASKLGTTVTWEGRENLPAFKLDGKTFNIYVFNHANPYYDNLALALLGTQAVAFFGAAEITMPKHVAKRLDSSDNYFVVKHDEDLTVVDKIEKLTKAGKVQGGFLAAEGYTGTGFYETRPLRKPFATLLLKKMKERGLTVNLIPITLPDGFRTMNVWLNSTEPDADALRATVHPIITHEMTDRLLTATGDPLSITRIVRAIWMERLRTDADTLLAMPSLDVQIDRLNQYLETP